MLQTRMKKFYFPCKKVDTFLHEKACSKPIRTCPYKSTYYEDTDVQMAKMRPKITKISRKMAKMRRLMTKSEEDAPQKK